eukprot:Amastigsp_a339523_393.p3 type:complete len:107 gc:universal Amastigsp_a339523_393:524-204(-)
MRSVSSTERRIGMSWMLTWRSLPRGPMMRSPQSSGTSGCSLGSIPNALSIASWRSTTSGTLHGGRPPRGFLQLDTPTTQVLSCWKSPSRSENDMSSTGKVSEKSIE